LTLKRAVENISLLDTCPSCSRRIWFKDETRSSRRRYSAPAWFRNLFQKQIGLYPLGTYYLDRCEVCGKTVAVFDKNKGVFTDKVIVLYACTLLDEPLGYCYGTKTCYNCAFKGDELTVERK